MSRLASTLLASALLLGSAPALARNVADVDVAETLSFEGKTLQLNGAGVRKKVIVKVYVGAMYLETPGTNAGDILKADQARVVKMTFVRSVDKGKILEAYKEGFEKNSKGDMGKLQPALDKLSAGIADMQKGQWMSVSYAPGKGVTVAQQSGAIVKFDGADAKTIGDALFRIWIGGEPADSGLKSAMLGGK